MRTSLRLCTALHSPLDTLTLLKVWQSPALWHDCAKLCAHSHWHTAIHTQLTAALTKCMSIFNSPLCPARGLRPAGLQWLCLQLRQHLSLWVKRDWRGNRILAAYKVPAHCPLFQKRKGIHHSSIFILCRGFGCLKCCRRPEHILKWKPTAWKTFFTAGRKEMSSHSKSETVFRVASFISELKYEKFQKLMQNVSIIKSSIFTFISY